MRGRGGFTLLELVVALAVFAVLATLAYGGLRQVLQARERLEAVDRELAAVQQAFAALERDLLQAADRPVRDALGDELPAFVGRGEPGEGPVLELTRAGRPNPVGLRRSHLERVAYALQGGRLERWSWEALDRAPGALPYREVLLEGVRSLRLRFLGPSGSGPAGDGWQPDWPPPSLPASRAGGEGGAPALPRAVELELELEGWGALRRLLAVREE